jgi:VWFA-related protein
MAFRRLLLVQAIAALVATSAGAQPQADTPVFKSGIEIVRLDVRVTDDQGRPIGDLRRDEIEVIEDGQSRPILLFQHIAEPAGSYVEVARRTIAGEVSTNRGAPRGHLYVLVFDQHHITTGNEQRARRAAEHFLKTRIRPGDRVALYALPGPGPQLPFTADIRRVGEELGRVRGSLERVGYGVLGTMSVHEAYEIRRGNQTVLARVANDLAQQAATDVLRGGLRQTTGTAAGGSDFAQLVVEDARTIAARADEEARRFLVILSDLMRELRGIEGRKALVLLSEGFYTDEVTRELERAAAAAAESYCVVYALDLNRRSDIVGSAEAVGGEHQDEIQSRLEPLATLAVETDGRLAPDAGSALDRTLDRIADASQDYYVVGFAPSPGAAKQRDGYHRVKVTVRRHGAQVSTRTGYSLTTPDTSPADRRRAIDRALGAPFPQQGLPIELTTYVLGSASPAVQRVVLSLAVELPIAAGSRAGVADVIFVVRRAADGQVAASGTDTVALPQAARPGATTGTSSYRVQFELPPGGYLMRVVVREPSGLVGSADRRFEVRPLASRDLSASDLIIGSASNGLPVRASARVGEILEGTIELYSRTAAGLQDASVTLELLPIGAGSAVTSVHADLLEPNEKDTGALRVARMALPLGAVPPGEYVAKAIVRARNETVAELLREVQVHDGSPPVGSIAVSIDPADVLQGEVTRLVLDATRRNATSETVARAATLALDGAWNKVEGTLGSGERSGGGLLLHGLALHARREFKGAAAALQAAAELEPLNSQIAFLLGWAYAGGGDDRAAIGAWRNAARLDPTLLPAHLALADTFIRLSEPALALQAVRSGLLARPTSPELLERLARLDRP